MIFSLRCWIDTLVSFHWFYQTVLTATAVVTTTLLFTYVKSTLQSWPARPGEGREPPVAPYCVPYLQHLFTFLYNPSRTIRSLHRKYHGQPFSLLMMNTKFHVFHESATTQHVFANSRTFVFEPVLASMMENGMDLPQADRPKFQIPSHIGSHEKDSSSFLTANHNIWLKHLTGKPLDDIMKVYWNMFHRALEAHMNLESQDWQSFNLQKLLRGMVFEASVNTFLGPRLWELWPQMWEDWNLFNNATYIGVRSNAAYRLNPRAGQARERMMRAFERWIEDQDMEPSWDEADGIWNETWGAKMNLERERLARTFGFSLRGRACLHASFLYVMNVNAVSLVTWFTWCAAHSASRLERFRLEASKFLVPSTTNKAYEVILDSDALKENTFTQGLWKEALRLGTAGSGARVVMEDSKLEGYMVRKGSVILMPTAIMHWDERLFPDPEKVKPERWIVRDDADSDAVEMLQRRQRSLRAFGGGTGLCSGRFVAEQEVIGIVSILLMLFDFDSDTTWKESYSFNPRSIGYMEAATDTTLRLRRR